MSRKAAFIVVALIALASGLFFAIAPGEIEKRTNMVDGKPLLEVSDEARSLHAKLRIVDLHSDTLLWKRSMLDLANRGHVDLPRRRSCPVKLP